MIWLSPKKAFWHTKPNTLSEKPNYGVHKIYL